MKDLNPKNHAEAVALFRSEIVGALTHRDLDRGELADALVELSKQRFRPPGAKFSKTFSLATLERWHCAYKSGGLDALKPTPRSDRVRCQELTDEQRQLFALIFLCSRSPDARHVAAARTSHALVPAQAGPKTPGSTAADGDAAQDVTDCVVRVDQRPGTTGGSPADSAEQGGFAMLDRGPRVRVPGTHAGAFLVSETSLSSTNLLRIV